MSPNNPKIVDWILHPEKMDAEAVECLPLLIAQFPFCATYKMLYSVALANTHSTNLNAQLQKTACALPDRAQLFLHVNNGEYEWVNLLHQIELERISKMENEDIQDDFALIDQYLSQQHLPNMDLDRMMPYSATEYSLEDRVFTSTAEDIDGVPLSNNSTDSEIENQESLIDQFLEADNNGQLMVPLADIPIKEIPTPEPDLIREKAFLTESLAKLYVKQHKFEQALAIFSQLNLQYSKKSNNFADQIRYLEKIIAYQKEANNTPESQKNN